MAVFDLHNRIYKLTSIHKLSTATYHHKLCYTIGALPGMLALDRAFDGLLLPFALASYQMLTIHSFPLLQWKMGLVCGIFKSIKGYARFITEMILFITTIAQLFSSNSFDTNAISNTASKPPC